MEAGYSRNLNLDLSSGSVPSSVPPDPFRSLFGRCRKSSFLPAFLLPSSERSLPSSFCGRVTSMLFPSDVTSYVSLAMSNRADLGGGYTDREESSAMLC